MKQGKGEEKGALSAYAFVESNFPMLHVKIKMKVVEHNCVVYVYVHTGEVTIEKTW